MNREDREEVTELLNLVLGKPIAEINGKVDGMQKDIVYIKGQTTITNHRVSKLEDATHSLEKEQADHVLKCPNTATINSNFNRIIELEKIDWGRKSIWKFIITSSLLIGTVVGIILGIVDVLFKTRI